MGLATTNSSETPFRRDITRLNQLAEQVGLFATIWLGQMIRSTYLPDHAKETYIATLAHNYHCLSSRQRTAQLRRLAYRLEQQFSTPTAPLAAHAWITNTAHLTDLPPLPSIAAERRFARYLALHDLDEFISAFAASTQQRGALRPWVATALRAAMRHNQLEQAWDNSITLWDSHNPPRPRTIIRAQLQHNLWQAKPPQGMWH